MSVALRKSFGDERLRDDLERLAERMPAGRAGLAARRDALADLNAAGLPSRRSEAWRYTDLASRLRDLPAQAGEPGTLTRAALDRALGPLAAIPAARIVFVDGWHVAELSSGEGLDAAADRIRLHEAMPTAPAGDDDAAGRDGATAMIEALATDGAHVVLGADGDGARAVAVMIVSVATGRTPARSVLRHRVEVGPGRNAQVIEVVLETEAAGGLMANEIGIDAGADARVEHARILIGPLPGTTILNARCTLAERAQLTTIQLAAGLSFGRSGIAVAFAGEDAVYEFAGVTLGTEREHFDTTMVIDHRVPSCTSRELFKAVLDGDSHAVFQGKVVVRPGAQKTDGKQMAQALLLSEAAEFYSKPELEIHADDVVCGHGATTGEIDEDMLFYMRARGIPEAEARALLIAAFVGEAIERASDGPLKDALGEIVAGRLKAVGR
ncbi:MAG: SufD family Fe-S cluster assembly protein [Hyphomicrobiaceae bacterium]